MNNIIQKPFSVFRDEDDKLYIVDDNERIVLADAFAYDKGLNSEERKLSSLNRMEDIVHALNMGW